MASAKSGPATPTTATSPALSFTAAPVDTTTFPAVGVPLAVANEVAPDAAVVLGPAVDVGDSLPESEAVVAASVASALVASVVAEDEFESESEDSDEEEDESSEEVSSEPFGAV